MVNLPMVKGYNVHHLLKLRIRNFVPHRLRVIQFRIPCQLVNLSTSKKTFFILLPSHPHNPSETPCLSGFQW